MALIEQRKLLRYRRIVVPVSRVQWYKSLFGAEGLFRPRRSFPDAEPVSVRGRRRVVRFEESRIPAAVLAPAASVPALGDGRSSGNGVVAGEGVGVPVVGGRVKAASQGTGLILKEETYPFPTFLHGILTVPRAEREFHNLLALRSLQFPAVEPLACGHSGFWILYHRSFLITREFTGAVNLKLWAKGQYSGIRRAELEKALLDFARELARLHRARCYVRTLYDKNILVRRAPDGRVELALCDVPRLWWFRGRGLSFGLAARDLASFDKWARQVFSVRSRLGFLKVYLERLREGPPLRSWVRRILRHRERMRHRTPVGRMSRKLKNTLKRLHLENYWPF